MTMMTMEDKKPKPKAKPKAGKSSAGGGKRTADGGFTDLIKTRKGMKIVM